MSEYIERERLKEAFIADLQKLQTLDEHTMDLILIEIEEAPAANVAEVVRCRDCKNLCVGGVWFGDARWGGGVQDTGGVRGLRFFCGFGERKEAEHDNCWEWRGPDEE